VRDPDTGYRRRMVENPMAIPLTDKTTVTLSDGSSFNQQNAIRGNDRPLIMKTKNVQDFTGSSVR